MHVNLQSVSRNCMFISLDHKYVPDTYMIDRYVLKHSAWIIESVKPTFELLLEYLKNIITLPPSSGGTFPMYISRPLWSEACWEVSDEPWPSVWNLPMRPFHLTPLTKSSSHCLLIYSILPILSVPTNHIMYSFLITN